MSSPTDGSMRLAWNRDINYRGKWIPGTARRHWLVEYAGVGYYERERWADIDPPSMFELGEKAYPVLRGARHKGFLERAEDVAADAYQLAVEACRAEGIPVVEDYPISMRSAIRSYGRLLAYIHIPGTDRLPKVETSLREVAEQPPLEERIWLDRLARVVRVLARQQLGTGVTNVTSDEEIIQASGHDPSSFVAITVDEFSTEAHRYPETLQALLTLSSHLNLNLPTVSLVEPPTVALWHQFDVTSMHFLRTIAQQPEVFRSMSGEHFEQFVAELFRRNGFEVIMTRQTRDGGYDLRIVRSVEPKLRVAFLVECKNPTSGKPVGVNVIRGLRGVDDSDRARTAGGIVVSTTRFTGDASREAEASGWGITLLDRNDVLVLLDKAIQVRH